jgi:hypothetical protein
MPALKVLISTLVEAVLLFDIFSSTESERLSFLYFLLVKYISKDLNHPGLFSLFHFVVLSDLSSTSEFQLRFWRIMPIQLLFLMLCGGLVTNF